MKLPLFAPLAATLWLAVPAAAQATPTPAPAASAPDASPSKLEPGSVAPTLGDVKWLQGAPVPGWARGQVYVLDFWATWCAPCKASIPHVNELHLAYKDKGVTFIGVAIWPKTGMVPTADFVREKGDAMAYSICEDIDSKTAKAFMTASGSNGIPTAMVIDQTGHVAWIGHPMAGLDEVLPAVLEKRFDIAAFAARRAAINEAMAALNAARKAGDWDQYAARIQTLIDLDPRKYLAYSVDKYDALLRAGHPERAAEYGRQAVKGPLADEQQVLNGLAWRIVDPDIDTDTRDLELARLAADRADELAGHASASVLDTLARVVFLQGDLEHAIELQSKAVELADSNLKAELEARLAEYRAQGQAPAGR